MEFSIVYIPHEVLFSGLTSIWAFPLNSVEYNLGFSKIMTTFCHNCMKANYSTKLKADRPHPRNYPHTPTDYRHTNKHLRLVMTPIALNCPQTDGWTDGQTDGRTLRDVDGCLYICHYNAVLKPVGKGCENDNFNP